MSTDADLAGVLSRLEQRLERLEAKVDQSLVQGRLAEPEVQRGLGELLDRLDRATAMVDALGTLSEKMPTLADAAASGAGWAWAHAEAAGIDPISTGRRAAALSLELAHPDNLDLVERLLKRKGDLLTLLDAAEAVDPAHLKVIARQGAALTPKLVKLLERPELARLLDAGADASTLSTAELATTALVATRAESPAPVGMFGALGKMGDADVQRAVGFTLALAKRFGQLLGR
jgi:uncharacterized protein YjgD (DUF1641 family)